MVRYSFSRDPGMVKELLQERDKHNVGGVECLLVGKPGSGKTTAASQIAIENKRRYGDVILIRGSEDCQWSYLINAGEPMDLIVKEGLEFSLYDRNTGKGVDPSNIFHKVKTYRTSTDLIERKLSHTNINIVQTTPYTATNPDQHLRFCLDWLDIYMSLNKRRWKRAVSVFIGEFEDLVPEGVGKRFYDVELSLSGIFRKNRKNDISSFLEVHSLEDVHWRIKKKIRWILYMRGAKQAGDSQIKKKLANLPVGTAILEGDEFERFEFRCMGNEKLLRAIVGMSENK